MNVLIFDIETIPDVNNGRKIYQLEALSDEETANKMAEIRREETNGSDFLRHYLHQIVVISVVLHRGNSLKVWSLGDSNSSEADLIKRFFEGIDKYSPALVSWNGSGFDLPVLHYRALYHGIACPSYWETGDEINEFRYNNYLNRYHYRHMDIMDILSGYQARATAPLDNIATMLGLPGKMGMDGSKVYSAYQAGEIESIRQYCETDVLNTYLVYLRFEKIRGKLTDAAYQQYCTQLQNLLQESQQPHFDQFLKAWQQHD